MIGARHGATLWVSSVGFISSFVIRISSLFRFAFAQQNYPDCCHQHQNTDDLKGQIVIAEKQRADVPHIVGCRACEWRKSLLGSLEVANHKPNLNEQYERYPDAARGSEPIDSTPFFGLEVEKHDDEKKKHHHGARVNQHLNDSDKEGVKRHEKSGEPQKRNNETESARDRITIDDNACAKDQR
jgi:hypothetical protein